MDLGSLLKLKQAWKTFSANHPKVPAFVEDVKKKGAEKDMELAVAIRYPDGTELRCGVRLQDSDIALFDIFK
ncbi:MAG: hypothetical protein J5822_09445 [Eubacteriaceae bacterium]|nr:hypothetical protein [Eubacteriaceae bacterium]